MMMRTQADRTAVFTEFVELTEPRLRRALVASYGPAVGREAAVDALSWAWEHWERIDGMQNPVGYLYRVGQTATTSPRTWPDSLSSSVAQSCWCTAMR